jgi:uroporphyrinogen decarboxylase
MNSRDRILAVLDHRLPDRVPLGELWIDPGVARTILPDGDGNDLVVHLDLDVVTAHTMIYADDEVEWVDPVKRIFRDKWGALQIGRHDGVPVPAKPPPIEGPEDLARYRPPDPARSPVIEKIRRLKERFPNGEKAICCVGESGWAPAVYLRGGLENLFLDFGLRPEFVRDLLKIGTEYYCELFPRVIAAGADVVLLGDDYSDKNGPMISPRQFADLVLPCDAAVVASVHRAGARVIKHTDGDIRKILDMLLDAGVDCLGPLEPVPGMELAPILQRYPGRIAVMGNLSVDLLSRGSTEDVVRETRRTLAEVSAVGPHIMSSANTITSSVRPENFLAMVRTTQQFGRLPIDVQTLRG